jgi:uncharacterized delta-60 repeat protein
MNANVIPLRAALAVLVAGLLVVAAPAARAFAAPGDLDPAFGTGGKVTTDFAQRFDEGWGLAIQPDGRIVIAGETVRDAGGRDDRDFAIVRYRPDGSLDPTFGAAGKVSTDFGKDFEVAFDMLRQPDGKIVAAGISGSIGDPASLDFAVARYNPDGSLDASFGTGGKVTTDFAGNDDEPNAVTLQPDGKIVLAGFTGVPADPGSYDIALARYNVDGSLDASFGAHGKVVTDFAGGKDGAFDILVQSHGRLLVAGSATRSPTGADFALARYNPNGSLDPSFGTSGKTTTDLTGADDQADCVVIQNDGKILAAGGAGVVRNASGAYALARFTADGALDTSFGTSGTVTTELTDGHDEVFGLALQRDGRIVAAGAAHFELAVSGDFALARYNRDGSLDRRFGSGGIVITDFGGGFDNAFDVAIQTNGAIVSVGEVTSSDATTSRDIGLARYLPS